ncbi:MAG: DUF4839 domain-containing protein [Aquihabitans sp.]
MPNVVGQRLDRAKSAIEEAGIDDEVEVESTGTFGVVDETNWTVCEQSPAAGAPITSAPKLSVDRSCDTDGEDDASTPSTEVEASTTAAPSTTEPKATSTTATPAPATLTPANNPDLAALLALGDYCDDSIPAFAAKYGGRTIEFDGSIGAMAPHEGAQTRFDILIGAGDFSTTTSRGPSFQFRDVNLSYDLHVGGPNVPDTLGVGANLHLVAEVGAYEPNTCLFQLSPIATTVR